MQKLPTPKMPELLAPAGNQEQLESALIYGADAVYLGGDGLNLRSGKGFTGPALCQAVDLAHAAGVKVYYCANALPYNHELAAMQERLESLPQSGVDALIVADPGVLHLARKACPGLEIHLSTQAHTVNMAAVEFWQEQGVTRVNLARELNIHNLRSVVQATRTLPQAMELEVFAHGALCLALSGHCLMSAWINQRPANSGLCTQPCRFAYRPTSPHSTSCPVPTSPLGLEEELRSGHTIWEVENTAPFHTVWAPEDQCLLPFVPWLCRQGFNSLKLEGRTKSGGALAPVVDAYKSLIMAWGRQDPKPRQLIPNLLAEVRGNSSRQLGTGFFLPKRKNAAQATAHSPAPIVGRVLEKGQDFCTVQVRSQWHDHRAVLLMLPGMQRPLLEGYTLENHLGQRASVLHSGTKACLHFPSGTEYLLQNLVPGMYIRLQSNQ